MFSTSQTYSGTYNFAPTGAEIVLNAFLRCRVHPTEIGAPHLQQAALEINFLQARMTSRMPNLWTIDLQALPLTQGQATYSLPAETLMITDAYVRTGSGQQTVDRMIFPISRTEYAAITNKEAQATPNQFWFDRTISPTITFYQTPDGEGPYTVYYYRVRNIQDAVLPNGFNIEVPYVWLDALTAGLAHRLARIYAPDLEQQRKLDAEEAWQVAAGQDVENVNMAIVPGLSGYFR
jgi:hypothetical protein